MGVLLVLGWIGLGLATFTWLMNRREDDPVWLVPLAIFIYFAAPLPFVGLLP